MVCVFGTDKQAFLVLLGVILQSSLNALVIPSCGKNTLIDATGTIRSPHYPKPFSSQVQCEWLIEMPKQTLLKIDILDVDLDRDCSQHWLSVPSEGGRGYNILCGQQFPSHPITVVQQFTYIKYFSSESKKESRGFALRYAMEEMDCGPNDLHCQNGDCLGNGSLCDGSRDCKDGSDEVGCTSVVVCNVGHLPCPSTPSVCYSTAEQRCNGELFCPHGEDELGCSVDCPKQIACASSDGCYDPAQRCNGVRNCRDNSDETFCGETMSCAPLEFICRNGACIPAIAICDGKDDCGDASDEEQCSKSSLLTAATLGLCTCGFLSCVGLMWLYRLYRARLLNDSTLSRNFPPEDEDPDDDDDDDDEDLVTDNFMYREPPPPYSAAVSQSAPLPLLGVCQSRTRRHRRRPRRCSRFENQAVPQHLPVHKPMLPSTVPATYSLASSSSSPSSVGESAALSTSLDNLLTL